MHFIFFRDREYALVTRQLFVGYYPTFDWAAHRARVDQLIEKHQCVRLSDLPTNKNESLSQWYYSPSRYQILVPLSNIYQFDADLQAEHSDCHQQIDSVREKEANEYKESIQKQSESVVKPGFWCRIFCKKCYK